MQITLEEAKTILDMFGYAHGEGAYTPEADALVGRILESFPELANARDDDGLPSYDHLWI